MYRRKLCMNLSRQFVIPYENQLHLLRRTGFEGFFCEWEPGLDMRSLRRAEPDMLFQSIHAPFTKMADMWTPTDSTETAVAELIACTQTCADNAVPLLIVHAFIGFEDHNPTDFGLDNYARVVREAERLGVKIAFENTEGEEYLAALMDHFRGTDAVGFCWDTGHQECYNPNTDMMARYGDRLLGTHINDNLGVRDYNGRIFWHDDLHLLPFDGIVDWPAAAAKIKRCGFDGPLTFELNTLSKPDRHENDAYGRMDIAEYFAHAYMRACRVAALVESA